VSESVNDDFNRETLDIMLAEIANIHPFMSQWSDAVDAKVLAAFTLASTLIGVIPAIGGVKADGWEWLPWIVAGIAWAAASLCCALAYSTRSFRVGPSPDVLMDAKWLTLTPEHYRLYRLRDLGKDWNNNWKVINSKATALGWSIPFIIIESAALVVALMVQGQ